MSSLLTKYGLDISKLKEPILTALSKIERLYPHTIITSTSEQVGVREVTSKHWYGNAVDIRGVTAGGEVILRGDIVEALGPGYDVIEYSWGFHVEWDPK